MVLQYFQFLRLGREGYRLVQQTCQDVAVHVARTLAAMPEFDVVVRRPRAAGGDVLGEPERVTKYTAYDVSRKLREHGWLVPAYTMPPKREDLVVLRVVVRNGFSHDMAELFLRDLRSCDRVAGRPGVRRCRWRSSPARSTTDVEVPRPQRGPRQSLGAALRRSQLYAELPCG